MGWIAELHTTSWHSKRAYNIAAWFGYEGLIFVDSWTGLGIRSDRSGSEA